VSPTPVKGKTHHPSVLDPDTSDIDLSDDEYPFPVPKREKIAEMKNWDASLLSSRGFSTEKFLHSSVIPAGAVISPGLR
jgi:hypothetical protein